MAEGARLESVYTATYRGFESLSLRQFTKYHQGCWFNLNQLRNTLKPDLVNTSGGSVKRDPISKTAILLIYSPPHELRQ